MIVAHQRRHASPLVHLPLLTKNLHTLASVCLSGGWCEGRLHGMWIAVKALPLETDRQGTLRGDKVSEHQTSYPTTDRDGDTKDVQHGHGKLVLLHKGDAGDLIAERDLCALSDKEDKSLPLRTAR